MQFPNPRIRNDQLPAAVRAILNNNRVISDYNLQGYGHWSKRQFVILNIPEMRIITVIRNRSNNRVLWAEWKLNILYRTPHLRLTRPFR